MNRLSHTCEVLIIGAGPAGLAAACSAAESGKRVTVVDDNPTLGGQIWRGEDPRPATPEAAAWLTRVRATRAELIDGARVFDRPEPGILLAETQNGVREIGYQSLILATGARERFLPFPGWTLPNVCGAGGLQALVKSGLPIEGKRVVIAGSGPLLLAVAVYLKKRGADIKLIAEQASWSSMMGFGIRLLRFPGKAVQAVGLRRKLAGVPYLAGCWPVSAEGSEKLTGVTLRRVGRIWDVPCDYLACGFHLVPNSELGAFLECELIDGATRVNKFQETTVANVYCAGEASGIGGLELSLVEGQIAGYAAAGRRDEAEKLFAERTKLRRFATMLDRAFALREELKGLAQPDTVVCRCEDVTFGRLRSQAGWRTAKLQTRCGMGACQGRICGGAVEFLLGWRSESVRPPVFPARVGSMTRT